MEAPLRVLKMPRGEARDRALQVLDSVGLAEKANAYPRQLSGGRQQRVAIARASAMRPMIMLFDEITSALDPELVGEVLRVVRDLAQETAMAMLIVTHEMTWAKDVSDRVIFMHAGRIEEDASPDVVFRTPNSEHTRASYARYSSAEAIIARLARSWPLLHWGVRESAPPKSTRGPTHLWSVQSVREGIGGRAECVLRCQVPVGNPVPRSRLQDARLAERHPPGVGLGGPGGTRSKTTWTTPPVWPYASMNQIRNLVGGTCSDSWLPTAAPRPHGALEPPGHPQSRSRRAARDLLVRAEDVRRSCRRPW